MITLQIITAVQVPVSPTCTDKITKYVAFFGLMIIFFPQITQFGEELESEKLKV